MTAPARDWRSMFSRWMAENGVSRGTSTSLRPSFSTTSAARSINLSASPWAMAASVPMVQGQITIASGGLEPEATGAGVFRPAGQLEVHFLTGDDLRRLRVEQLHAAAGGEQAFEQADAVGQAGGAGQREANGFGRGGFRHGGLPKARVHSSV